MRLPRITDITTKIIRKKSTAAPVGLWPLISSHSGKS